MLLAVVIAMVAVGGGAVYLLRGGGQPVRLSNGRIISRAGMLVTVRADYRATRVDPTARYIFVVRSGDQMIAERPLRPDELRGTGNLEVTAGVLPNAVPAAIDGVIEVEKPGGREPASNVVRCR
jgi:hypothetical protein